MHHSVPHPLKHRLWVLRTSDRHIFYDYLIVQCVMLYGLELRLQRCFERHGAYEMFQELKLIFQANAQVERYEVSNKFFSCKMEENSSVNEHILRMSGYHNHLTRLGIDLPV